MSKQLSTELVHEGRYAAEVDVTLIETDNEWSPYYSLQDVTKLDTVREALRRGDIETASQYGRVYELKPVKAAE